MNTLYKESPVREGIREKGNNEESSDSVGSSQTFVRANKSVDSKQYATLMNFKENRFYNYKERTLLFGSIGLCLSLLLIIGAFELKFYGEESTIKLNKDVEKFEDLVDVPQTEQPPPPPPKVEQVQIVEVEDEEVVEEVEFNLDVEMTEDTKIEETVEASISEEMPEEEADEIFTIVEEKPTPKGGMQRFYQYISENLKYPSRAERMNIEGRVFVQFVVEKDGSLTEFKVVRGIGAGCDKEAIRVLENAPEWNPGKQRGRPVRVRMVIPINFKLMS